MVSVFFFFKQKTAYEMRISDWSSACALPIYPGPTSRTSWSRMERPSISNRSRHICFERTDRFTRGSGHRRLIFELKPSSSGADRGSPDEDGRSEEHTSELQSLMRISYDVFCLKKKKNYTYNRSLISLFFFSYLLITV